MNNNLGSIYRSSSAIFAFFIIFFANYAQAALSPFQSFVGNVGLSTDGFGSTTESGIISASVPAGSTVLAAYLYSATNTSSTIPTVQLDGTLKNLALKKNKPNFLDLKYLVKSNLTR